jgi:phospholipid-binding lipoprotein MlaA
MLLEASGTFWVQGGIVDRLVDFVSTLRGQMAQRGNTIARPFLLLAFTASLGACATVNDPDDPAAIARYEINDPFEEFNRAFHSVNMFADEVVVAPVAIGYTTIVPKPARRSITNFMDNLTSPVTLANDLLQFEFVRASTTLSRMVINSTIGIGGLFDPAQSMGLDGHKEDFGQTLAVYGFGEGFFFMAPLLGPAPPRDLLGIVIDSAINPLNYTQQQDTWLLRIGLATFDTVNDRAENIETLQNLERTSLDYYATLRSMYRQNRKSEIANGRDLNDLPDFEFELDDAFDLDDEEDPFELGDDEDLFFDDEEP